MTGIIIKDLWESVCLKNNLIGTIFAVSLQVCIILFLPKNIFVMALIIMFSIPAVSSSPIQYSLEQDEISKFDTILLTFPLTKKEIIQSKFMACLIYSIIAWIVTLVTMFIYVFVYHVTDIQTGMIFWYGGVLLSLFFLSIFAIGFFLFGNKKGQIIYTVMVVIFAIMIVVSRMFEFDILMVLNTSPYVLLGIGSVLVVILLYLSYLTCVKIYTKKHS